MLLPDGVIDPDLGRDDNGGRGGATFMGTIYFDHHATTPVDPRVLEAMLPFFAETFANAGSAHGAGRQAARAIDRARQQVAALIRAHEDEVCFTSGATESNNLALKGVSRGVLPGSVLVTSAVEHKSILQTARVLAEQGFGVTRLPVDVQGRVDLGALDLALARRDRPFLVSVMGAQNEVGTLQPIDRIVSMSADRRVPVHVDGAQWVGRVAVDVRKTPVALLSMTAHKMYGPKGVGALFVRREFRDKLCPEIHGGGQECGLRSGTLPVPQIVGFGMACEVAAGRMAEDNERLTAMRSALWRGIQRICPTARLNGDPVLRLPGNLSVTLPGVDAEVLMLALGSIAVSSGSACSASDATPSHVLTAMGLSPEECAATVRIGLGRYNTDAEISTFLETLSDKLRQLHGSPDASQGSATGWASPDSDHVRVRTNR